MTTHPITAIAHPRTGYDTASAGGRATDQWPRRMGPGRGHWGQEDAVTTRSGWLLLASRLE